jgi:hypothetical protein
MLSTRPARGWGSDLPLAFQTTNALGLRFSAKLTNETPEVESMLM